LAMGEGFVELRIADNGKGFEGHDPFRPGGGFGLWAMRARAQAVGGQLTVTSRPGEGTTVAARLPLEGGESDAASDEDPDRR
jgi:signal transduction histidine kinase